MKTINNSQEWKKATTQCGPFAFIHFLRDKARQGGVNDVIGEE